MRGRAGCGREEVSHGRGSLVAEIRPIGRNVGDFGWQLRHSSTWSSLPLVFVFLATFSPSSRSSATLLPFFPSLPPSLPLSPSRNWILKILHLARGVKERRRDEGERGNHMTRPGAEGRQLAPAVRKEVAGERKIEIDRSRERER